MAVMITTIKNSLCLILLIFLIACNNSKDYENIKKVKIGDTKEIVNSIMGKPDTIRKAPFDSAWLMYDYGMPLGGSDNIAVYFDSTNTVISKTNGD